MHTLAAVGMLSDRRHGLRNNGRMIDRVVEEPINTNQIKSCVGSWRGRFTFTRGNSKNRNYAPEESKGIMAPGGHNPNGQNYEKGYIKVS